MMDKQWLPEGHHWGLVIEHRPISTGPFVAGAGHKILWHTTEGYGIDAMHRVLTGKGAQVNFLIDPSAGDSRVIQMLPITSYGKGLEHPPGTPETNRAGATQIEIVDFARNAPGWGSAFYRDLAALACLIDHRYDVPRNSPAEGWHSSGQVKRMGPAEFIRYAGHCGHQHAPNQPAGHWDPGAMNTRSLFAQMSIVERHYK